MTHSAIVATYSDTALAGIIRQLTASGGWKERLEAAKQERQRREIHNQQQDKESTL